MAWAYFVVTSSRQRRDPGPGFDPPPWWVLLIVIIVALVIILGIPAKIVGWW